MQQESNKHSRIYSSIRKPYGCPNLIKHQNYPIFIQIQTISVTGNSVNTTFGTENYFGD